jgi:predicted negative regulator of RcsB-dependent stress response
MGQFVLVILVVAAVFGIYRCNGSQTDNTEKAGSNLDATLQAPAQVKQTLEQQVELINQRNRETLDRY